ncbi:adenosylcobinamide-GDP ribazoletransferase [Amorphus orientalis]|uniref:Adenosylcobinamide-GDP ribazoletransferase n=1 Tax=Amorphus orientalis TaxID=649198 RepID=A0AAE4AU60_9HYPH|nr:adenosylcobinamide-GDP ribazoletransferase [Amorphus orientalis]MDQ0316995.1 adenosylcobinamide-GDP ribazoletransferase [Amorphus orientalis]
MSDRRSDGPVAAYLADSVVCLRFFSRLTPALPASVSALAGRRRMVGAVRALPVASLAIALPAAIALVVVLLVGLPPLAASGIALAVLAVTTGALHEDGLADVCDGFFGGRDAPQRLEIMRDSRTGAFGALGLALTVLVRASLLAAVAEQAGALSAGLALLAAAVASRTALLWPWIKTPPARPDGLARLVGRPDPSAAALAAATALVLVLVMTPGFAPVAVVPGAIGALAVAWGMSRAAEWRIGGHTGDVLGATQQLAEIVMLAAIVVTLT